MIGKCKAAVYSSLQETEKSDMIAGIEIWKTKKGKTMTEKIYYSDVYCKEFSAAVLDCRERKNGYEVVLDRTAFYPEGGGQPGDRGCFLAEDKKEIRIYDTHEKGEEILHYTEEYLEPGTKITGRIDWDFRFDLMQNHSGEHIVSGLIHERFGYQNVGFHMGSDVLTIDLDGEFSVEEMREFERRANEIIWENRPVDIRVYTEEEVKAVEYRSKKELHGQVRIVTFPGADICACCGTHVSHTGEIGLIKLISLQKFKGGVRMEMLCGRRALEYVNRICEQNHQISVALSAKPEETAAAVQRLKETEMKDSFRLVALENEMFARKAESLKDCGDILLFEDGLNSDSVRKLAVAVMEVCGGRCAVFSGDEETGYKYALGKKDGDLRAFVKEMNSSLNGRGGGKPFFAQGSVNAKRKEIEAFFNKK